MPEEVLQNIVRLAGKKNWNYCDSTADIVKNPFYYWSAVKEDIHNYINSPSMQDYLEYPVLLSEQKYFS